MVPRHVLLASALIAGATGVGHAQDAATYDANQLPAVHGKVAQYSLTPRGDVDGLILTDGTEVHTPPHLGTQLVLAVRPGDTVTVHGLHARAIPMVQAMAVTNDATGSTVTDNGVGGPPGPRGAEQVLTAQGRIKAQLHGPRGDLNGALLEDGTIVRVPPAEAQRLAGELTPGAPLCVQGEGSAGPLGRVIEPGSIGPNANQLVQIGAPPPPGPGRRPPGPGPGVAPPPPPGPPG
ncbi:MAG TPA: hypothetical protein VGM32_09140 [Rhodopila sp.]|jgi:hypothetical protein